MRRKVIQIADSTQLVSLPRKWALQHGIKKGDELNVEANGSTLTIACELKPKLERAEVKLNSLGTLAPRLIHALYKRGIDEIKIYLESPAEFKELQRILSNETVGFEIIEQGQNYCLVKNVSGNIEGFDNVLRRTFLLLSNMANDCVDALENSDQDFFSNLLLLEKSNNRFTSICRRYLNKNGSDSFSKVGPIYYIIEDVENVADEYKYLFQQLCKVKSKDLKIKKEHVNIYRKIAEMITLFRESFYKKDNEKLKKLADLRKELIDDCYIELEKAKSFSEFVTMHHALVIIQKVFNFVGPYFVIGSEDSIQK